MLIREGKLVVCFFVLHTYNDKLDLHVVGVNGYFEEPERLSHLLSNTDEYDMSPINRSIREKYGVSESDEFYDVYVELEYVPAEYGDYGQCYAESYYTISEVVEIEKKVFELEEGFESTEPAQAEGGSF